MKYSAFIIFLCSFLFNCGCITGRQNPNEFLDGVSLVLQEQKAQNDTQKEIKTKLMDLEKMLQDIDTKLSHVLDQKAESQISREKEIATLMLEQHSDLLELMNAKKAFEKQINEKAGDQKKKITIVDGHEGINRVLDEDSGKNDNLTRFNPEKIQVARQIEPRVDKKEKICEKHKNVTPEYLYEKAMQTINKQEYQKALGLLDEMTACFAGHGLMPDAYFWQGEAFYQLQDFKNAVISYKKVIENYPETNKYAAALLKAGLSDYAMDNKKEGHLRLEELIRKFPGRAEARRAEIFLNNR